MSESKARRRVITRFYWEEPQHSYRVREAVKQFQVVKRLINNAGSEQIVCATDAGREGENIFRLIYEHARCKKPVQRLWVSSLTDEAIREGFRRLRPGSAYDDLGQAARARAQADWLVGMNLTRAYTVHNRVLCTIGRVQTPTLAMIVQRDKQIASFRKAYVDKTKLTDHHAILPTGKTPPPALPPTLRKIYDLVVTRFVGVFLPDQVVEETAVTLDIGGAAFVAKGTLVLEAGWKQVERPGSGGWRSNFNTAN